MLSLNSLAGWEESVMASIAGATGTPDQRDSQIERSGLYGEYPAIVNTYIEHFSDPDTALEALKRAYFLVWRSAMAAPSETGIPPLPDGTIRVVIDELDAWSRRAVPDDELRWMLGHYHERGPSVLELYGASPRLVHLAASGGEDDWRRVAPSAATMTGRGQMGRYWSALLSNSP
ncbi:MAG TPA: hypothetical protein VF461_14280 [Gemmatimonadaceae bacterium]